MQRILILSDTHGYLDPKACRYLEDCDEIWHAGDIGTPGLLEELKNLKPLRAVYGNIDNTALRKELQEDLVFTLEDVKVYMTHIAGPQGKYLPRVKKIMQEERPRLFVCGHSHILKVVFDKQFNLLYLNPGAAGNQGFHKVKTMVRLKLEAGEMKDLEVIELGARAAIS